MVAGVCALLIRRGRLIRAAIVLQPSTPLRFDRALVQRKYRLLLSSTVRKTPGPKGPHPNAIAGRGRGRSGSNAPDACDVKSVLEIGAAGPRQRGMRRRPSGRSTAP